jgi:hypothetical protein
MGSPAIWVTLIFTDVQGQGRSALAGWVCLFSAIGLCARPLRLNNIDDLPKLGRLGYDPRVGDNVYQ